MLRHISSTTLCLALACGGEATSTIDAGRSDTDASTSRDAAAERDAGDHDGGTLVGRDGGPPPEGTVAAFVAVGWGGRRLSSCDGGRTWGADQQDASEGDDDWHRSFTPKGLAYGGGHFVFLTGWGTDSSVHVTTDGATWTSRALDTSYGAVGWSDGRFVLVGNRRLAASADGSRFEPLTQEAASFDRAGGAFDGVWAAGADGSVEVSLGGVAWQRVASCSGTRHGHIGFEGGFAAGGGVLLSVGHDGNTCAVDVATREDLGAGSVGRPTPGPPTHAEGAFVLATGGRLHRSVDGVSWTEQNLPAGVAFELVARASDGTWVGVSQDGDRFFFSDDGTNWQRGTGPSGNGLLYVMAGRVAVSERCPERDR